MTDLFEEWNLILLKEYFTPAVAGEEVWIQTSRSELDAFGFHLGGAAGLIDTVKLGPTWYRMGNTDLAQNAMSLAKFRLSPTKRPLRYQDPGDTSEFYKQLHAPTYLPYVALWVLAASQQESEGFYKTVGGLVGFEFQGSAARKAMEVLWQDLEFWSKKQCQGQFGLFYSKPLGAHPYVGLAKAQALVTGKDREGMHRLFKQEGLAGGQALSDEEFSMLASVGKNSYYLSKSLCEAMGKLETYGSVLQELFSSRLLEWNGRISAAQTSGTNPNSIGADDDQHIHEIEDELSVVLRPAFETDWELGWRFESSADAEGYTLDIGNSIYRGCLNATTGYVTCLDPANDKQLAVQSVFNSPADHETIAAVGYIRDGDENGQTSRSYIFRSKSTRLFGWDALNPIHAQELVERTLPVAGPVYLLSSATTVFDWLDKNNIEHSRVEEKKGLPEGWSLCAVLRVEDLSLAQKSAIQALVGDPEDGFVRARIKFVSGCPILRGGKKQYADYDLPLVELDAPIGCEVEADGLRLEEVTLSNSISSDVHQSSIRRFVIHRESHERHRFELIATLNQGILCKATLKVALSVGLEASAGKAFAIDRFGESHRSVGGIRGAILDDNIERTTPPVFRTFAGTASWGRPTSLDEYDQYVKSNIACQLVDMVAQKGSIEYGAAKLMILRLADGANVKPAILMLQLRSRGFLEVETDQKGRLLRLHAASPTIYSTPITLSTGAQWYGICGSLRLEQWRQLIVYTGIAARIELSSPQYIPTIRLSVTHKDTLAGLVEHGNFQIVDYPALTVSIWASTLVQKRQRLQSNKGYENFRVNNQQRLNPQKALFSYDRSVYMKVDPFRKVELFKIDDPVIQGSQVYMLGSLVDEGEEYNYIQDSRWGVWLAISAFSQMLLEQGYDSVAYPWPIPYAQRDGSFWLPARLKPPVLLERALCFSSGGQPEQVRVKKIASMDEDYVELVDAAANDQPIGKVSRLYTEMCDGKWLRYPYVPEELADSVATHLGCKLMYL